MSLWEMVVTNLASRTALIPEVIGDEADRLLESADWTDELMDMVAKDYEAGVFDDRKRGK